MELSISKFYEDLWFIFVIVVYTKFLFLPFWTKNFIISSQ